jgi:hypothetical protein
MKRYDLDLVTRSDGLMRTVKRTFDLKQREFD